MIAITNLDLLAVGITVAAIGVLGLAVFLNNRQSVTNRTFFILSLIAIFYAGVNYYSYQTASKELTLWLLRFVLLSAVWYSFFLFQLYYVFPKDDIKFSPFYKFILTPATTLVSILILTPLVFSRIDQLAPIGEVTNPERGPGIFLFALMTLYLVVSGMVLLFRKTLRATGLEKKQFRSVLAGTLISYSLLITFNMVLPVFFNNLKLIPFAPVFTIPFIAFTAYAVMKHHLLDVKVIATEILTFLLAVFTFIEVIFATTIGQRIFRILVFVVISLVSMLLIKSVRKEVEQREELQKLTEELQKTNQRLDEANKRLEKFDKAKTEFLSITSHQLRTPLTGIKGYLSMMLEGDFGKFSGSQEETVKRVAAEVDRLARMVQVFLNVSRIESGKLIIAKLDFNFADLINTVIKELKPIAEKKGLALTYSGPNSLPYKGDSDKLKDVVMNLVDNAIKYTPTGKIWLEAQSDMNGITLLVHDTGVGIDPSEDGQLFEKFSRAKGIAEVNAEGTGLGLFIVKKIVEAHKGHVSVESPGLGKGSTFVVFLPA